MAARKGIITFGLVSIPVELHVAARAASLDFDLLHAKDRGRIRYKLWCAEENREVARKDTVKGYKVDGDYVVMADEDFDQAERATSRAIDVVHFVDLDQIDPIYLERSYYVGAQPDLERGYQVLLAAMRKTKSAAVVTFVMSRRQHYALLRPDEDRLVLHTLYYADEVQAFEKDWKASRPSEREVDFAEQYIKALRQDFEPARYHDQYRETLLEVIRAKAEGQTLQLPEAPKPRAKVVDLVKALRASVEQVRKPLARADAKREAATAPAGRRRKTAHSRGARRSPVRHAA
jgi:DNA end-binding protein Ku